MIVQERKLGRIFQLKLEDGDDLFEELNRFVKEENIRAGSVFVFGAMGTMDVVVGLKSAEGFDPDRRHFEDKRELVAFGNITWPDKPPPVLGDISWDQPQPFVHLHLAMSGGPGKTEDVLVGHLSGGEVKGMFVDIYELL